MDRDRQELMAYLERQAAGPMPPPAPRAAAPFEPMAPQGPGTQGPPGMRERVNLLASHMTQQWHEHDEAITNTNRLFEQLLGDLENLSVCFRESFAGRNVPEQQVYARVDADRSVGILNVLWHTVSFTTRGNTKPMAMYRFGREPVFAGRIIAIMGDFGQLASFEQDFSDLLGHEVASLYVPADPETPAVMSIRHLGDEEHYLNQTEAARQFLYKTVEMVCAGGFFHEKDFY